MSACASAPALANCKVAFEDLLLAAPDSGARQGQVRLRLWTQHLRKAGLHFDLLSRCSAG
jgi:hypothetical protein